MRPWALVVLTSTILSPPLFAEDTPFERWLRERLAAGDSAEVIGCEELLTAAQTPSTVGPEVSDLFLTGWNTDDGPFFLQGEIRDNGFPIYFEPSREKMDQLVHDFDLEPFREAYLDALFFLTTNGGPKAKGYLSSPDSELMSLARLEREIQRFEDEDNLDSLYFILVFAEFLPEARSYELSTRLTPGFLRKVQETAIKASYANDKARERSGLLLSILVKKGVSFKAPREIVESALRQIGLPFELDRDAQAATIMAETNTRETHADDLGDQNYSHEDVVARLVLTVVYYLRFTVPQGPPSDLVEYALETVLTILFENRSQFEALPDPRLVRNMKQLALQLIRDGGLPAPRVRGIVDRTLHMELVPAVYWLLETESPD